MSNPDSYYEFLFWPGDGSTLAGWTIRDTGTTYVGATTYDINGGYSQITYESPYAVDLGDWYYAQGYDGSAYEDGVVNFTSYTPPTGTSAAISADVADYIHSFDTALAAPWL